MFSTLSRRSLRLVFVRLSLATALVSAVSGCGRISSTDAANLSDERGRSLCWQEIAPDDGTGTSRPMFFVKPYGTGQWAVGVYDLGPDRPPYIELLFNEVDRTADFVKLRLVGGEDTRGDGFRWYSIELGASGIRRAYVDDPTNWQNWMNGSWVACN